MIVVGSGALVAACRGPLSTLDAVGPNAISAERLWWVMFAGACAILVVVMALVLLAFTRWRHLLAFPTRFWLVGGGLVFPIVTLAALLVYALVTGERLLAHPDTRGVLQVQAIARQWQWTFRHPDADGVTTENVLHMPAGQPVDVHITSEDVIHSFWIPRLAGKIDAIPGHTNVIRLIAPDPGTYLAQCAEFCGFGHAHMRFVAEVLPPEDYAARLDVLAGSAANGNDQ